MLDRVTQLEQEANSELKAVRDAQQLEAFRIKYLGSRGALKVIMAMIQEVPKQDKPRFGQAANALSRQIREAFEKKKRDLDANAKQATGPLIDVTEPGAPPRLGRTHVITQTIHGLIEIFGRMGFEVTFGPEVEDEYHNFVALNIPPEHPARDPLENFYLEGGNLLRSQTSTVQIRVMEKTPPPLRIVSIGRVYRPDEHDATHSSMFHQIEGLYVDRNVSMVDLKTALFQFARAFFGDEAEIRLRPSYFPFTEPSAELDIKMKVKDKWQWVELGGCGMVDPNVFEAVGYDAEQWTGFAFGMGVERIAMASHGIQDIRLLFENDLRFLRQF